VLTFLALFFVSRTSGLGGGEAHALEPSSASEVLAEKRKPIPLRPILANLVDRRGRINPKAVEALAVLSGERLSEILAEFTGEDSPKQYALLKVLSYHPKRKVAHKLLEILTQGPPWRMARRIGQVLASWDRREFVPELLRLLRSENRTTRAGAVLALRPRPTEEVAAKLVELLRQEKVPEIRREILLTLALARLGRRIQAIRLGLQDPDPAVRLTAVKLAGEKGGRELLTDLRELFNRERSQRIRRAIIRAITRIGQRSGKGR